MREIFAKLSYLFTRREKRNGALLFALMVGGAFFEVVGVGAVPAFVAAISIPDRLLERAPVRWAYDRLGMESPQEMVMWAAIGLMGLFVLKNVYLGALAYARARYITGRQFTISNRLFRAYLRAPYTFHLQRNTAELLRNTNSEATVVMGGVLLPLMNMVMEAMVLAFIFALLFAIEPLATLVVFTVFGLITYVFLRFTRARVASYAKEEQEHRKQSMQAVNQGLGGFKDARVLGRESFFLRSYAESAQFKAEAARYKKVISALPRLFLETLAVVGMLSITALFVVQDRDLAAIIPTLVLLGAAIVRLMPSFTKVASDFNALKWGERALRVVYADIKELADEERAWEERHRSQATKPIAFEHAIRLDELRYRYPGADEDALRGVSLTIPRFASVGFVGPSGAGKTTVVDVILGLLTPTEGRVLVDGADVQERLASWQRKIGYIPQHIYLTDDTIRRNVAFGQSDEEIDDADVWEALEAAQLADLVASFDEGLDVKVGERGVRLSGGQRQRIGIARALYHKPEVLVMDEATSALDNQTERHVVDALNRLQGSHTTIVIAHRLSTVRNCDTLFMLDDGELVASGTYDELLDHSDAFRRMAGRPDAMAS